MLKKIRLIIGIMVLFTALFGLLTKNYFLQPLMLFGLSAFIFVGGLDEFKQGKKTRGYVSFFISVFVFAVFIQTLLTQY